MTFSQDQLACLLAFGPLVAGALALVAAHVVIEINTQRAARRAWAPIRKDRRHG